MDEGVEFEDWIEDVYIDFEEELEEDEISPREEAFMSGYSEVIENEP